MHQRITNKPVSSGMTGGVLTPPTNAVERVKAIREGHKIKTDMRIDEFMKGSSALETSANADTRMTSINRKSIDRATNSTTGVTNLD